MLWLFVALIGIVAAKSTHISATDDNIVYTGRVFSPEFNNVLFDWSGIEISMSVSVQESTEVVALFSGASHFYNILVDGNIIIYY